MSEAFVNKNVKLSLEFDEYVSKHPQLLEYIPNGAYVVITTTNDKKINQANLSLIRNKRSKKVVEARKAGAKWSIRPLQINTA